MLGTCDFVVLVPWSAQVSLVVELPGDCRSSLALLGYGIRSPNRFYKEIRPIIQVDNILLSQAAISHWERHKAIAGV
jgi:hypothetical protein